MAGLSKQQLLAEIEDCIRTMPDLPAFAAADPSAVAWSGRVSAVVHEWDYIRSAGIGLALRGLSLSALQVSSKAQALSLLHEAAHALRLETVGPLSIPVDQGAFFEYFEGVRAVVEQAKQDLFFIDRYLDPEFVARYMPLVSNGVPVRLLTREKVTALLPAVEAFAKQHGTSIEIRSSAAIHDRFVFVDRIACYQSGASFRDGARLSPTTLTQILDAFPAMLQTYEALWAAATVRGKY